MRPLYSPHLPTTAHPQGWASSCSLHEPGLWPFVTGLELALWPKLDQSSIVLKESRGASQRELQVSGVAWSVKLKTKHEVTRGSILLLHPDLEVEKAHEQKEKNGEKKKKRCAEKELERVQNELLISTLSHCCPWNTPLFVHVLKLSSPCKPHPLTKWIPLLPPLYSPPSPWAPHVFLAPWLPISYSLKGLTGRILSLALKSSGVVSLRGWAESERIQRHVSSELGDTLVVGEMSHTIKMIFKIPFGKVHLIYKMLPAPKGTGSHMDSKHQTGHTWKLNGAFHTSFSSYVFWEVWILWDQIFQGPTSLDSAVSYMISRILPHPWGKRQPPGVPGNHEIPYVQAMCHKLIFL